MQHIVVINPNTSAATTAMMTDLVRAVLPAHVSADGMTARVGVPMIVDPVQLEASVAGVVEMGLSAAKTADGLIVCAFGDPGLDALRSRINIPVVGICEASMLEAAAGGRRFGIATVTPDLVGSFADKAAALGLADRFTGTRLTRGDPLHLTGDPERLYAALAIAVRQSLDQDGAEAVIIGGGPLGRAASELQRHVSAPVIAPIASAAALLLARMAEADARAAG